MDVIAEFRSIGEDGFFEDLEALLAAEEGVLDPELLSLLDTQQTTSDTEATCQAPDADAVSATLKTGVPEPSYPGCTRTVTTAVGVSSTLGSAAWTLDQHSGQYDMVSSPFYTSQLLQQSWMHSISTSHSCPSSITTAAGNSPTLSHMSVGTAVAASSAAVLPNSSQAHGRKRSAQQCSQQVPEFVTDAETAKRQCVQGIFARMLRQGQQQQGQEQQQQQQLGVYPGLASQSAVQQQLLSWADPNNTVGSSSQTYFQQPNNISPQHTLQVLQPLPQPQLAEIVMPAAAAAVAAEGGANPTAVSPLMPTAAVLGSAWPGEDVWQQQQQQQQQQGVDMSVQPLLGSYNQPVLLMDPYQQQQQQQLAEPVQPAEGQQQQQQEGAVLSAAPTYTGVKQTRPGSNRFKAFIWCEGVGASGKVAHLGTFGTREAAAERYAQAVSFKQRTIPLLRGLTQGAKDSLWAWACAKHQEANLAVTQEGSKFMLRWQDL